MEQVKRKDETLYIGSDFTRAYEIKGDINLANAKAVCKIRDKNDELLIEKPLEDVVLKWANNAKEAGLDGVVCSPLESKIIHDNLGTDFLTVTPGIRLASDSVNDQKRVTTPAMARELTSSYIVVGRTITASDDPYTTYRKVYQDFQG